MTGQELRELRKSLGLSAPWCAEQIGDVALRTWQYWEDGRDGKPVPVPVDVQRNMLALREFLVSLDAQSHKISRVLE